MDLSEIIVDQEVFTLGIEINARERVWVDKKGNRYNIKDMSTELIKNCLKLIKRGFVIFDCYKGIFEKELENRGEI